MRDRRTNGLTRRTGDAKESRRRPEMESSENMAWRTAKKYRAYCPSCGMVRYDRDNWATKQIQGDVVVAHKVSTGEDRFTKEDCPGGAIDRVKDRAP